MIRLTDPARIGPALAEIRGMLGIPRREVARRIAEATGRTLTSVNAQVWEWDVGRRRPDLKSLVPLLDVIDFDLALAPRRDPDDPAPVALSLLTAARLVAGHVDILWSQWANGDDDSRGCCPHCCAPCSALKDLLDAGLLDDLYGAYVDQGGGEMSTWDAEKRQVGRDWLTEAWSVDLGCGPHDDDPCRCGDPNCQWNGSGAVMRSLGWPDRRPVANRERLSKPTGIGEHLSKPTRA